MTNNRVYLIATDGDLVDRLDANLQLLGNDATVISDNPELLFSAPSPSAVIYDRAALLVPEVRARVEQALAQGDMPLLNLVDNHTPPPATGINLTKPVELCTLGAALRYATGDPGVAWLFGAMANLGEALAVIDGHQRIQVMNRAAQRMTGYPGASVLDAPVDTIVDLRDARQQGITARLVREVITRGLPVSAGDAVSLVDREGRRLDVQVFLNPIPVAWAPAPGIVLTIRDVTQRRRDDIERQRLIQRLTDANSEMERFVYTISHDLKSPLVTIGGFAGMLAKDIQRANHDRIDEDLAEIRKATVHMQALVDGLLRLSRAGRVVGEPVCVALPDILSKVVTGLRAAIRENHAQVQLAPDLPAVAVDPLRFTQVFEILIDNALKYRVEGVNPLIEIGCRREQGELHIFVADNGPGIPATDHARVFSLFERGDSHADGSGVGLALARRIVEAHGGRIWVEAGNNGGTTFWIALPDSVTVK